MFFFTRFLPILAASALLCTATVASSKQIQLSRSEVEVSDRAIADFQQLKLQKSIGFIISNITNGYREIDTQLTLDRDVPWNDFVEKLPENQCRCGIGDFEYMTREGTQRNKIVFVSWKPDGATVKDRIIHGSSNNTLRRKLLGIQVEIQAEDMDEVTYDAILKRVKGA